MMRRILQAFSMYMLLATPTVVSGQVPSPTEFFDFAYSGEAYRFLHPHQISAYCDAISSGAPRNVRQIVYGETYEHRPLQVLAVSSEANLARLEEIRTNHLRRLGVLAGSPTGSDDPVIVWLSFGIHGNEASSPDAALQLLWGLLAAEDDATPLLLERAVILIDPCVNPDGRARFLHNYYSRSGLHPNPDPVSWEHLEAWPSGRSNHYLYDLNRDWAWQTQTESRQRGALYQQWLPHVHADFHEMGADDNYYFLPAAKPYHEVLTGWQREFQQLLGAANQQAFDAQGWRYFTREVFDLFYPSYGDTWPMYQGAIGMTYEQAGIGAGLAYDHPSGDRLTLEDRIRHHVTTARNTIQISVANAARLRQEQEAFYKSPLQAAPGPYEHYIVAGNNDPLVLRHLIQLLERQGILYNYVLEAPAGKPVQGYDYQRHQSGVVHLQKGDLVISTRQPKGILVKVLFEPGPALEDSLTYDLTAWSLPFAMNLRAFAANGLSGLKLGNPEQAPAVGATESNTAWGFVLPAGGSSTAFDLARLFRLGVRPHLLTQPTILDGHTFPAGSLVVLEDDSLQRQAFAQVRWQAVPISSSRVTSGPDIGSYHNPQLRPPKVAVLAGPEVSTHTLGDVWHFFDRQLDYPVTLLPTDRLNRQPWRGYDVLILPGGRLKNAFSEDDLANLRQWIRDGGRVIALEGALSLFADQKGYGLKGRPEAEPATTNRTPYADATRKGLSQEVAGAIYPVVMDTTHPLAFGTGSSYQALVSRSQTYELLAEGWNVGVIEQPKPVAGFVGAGLQPAFSQSLAVGVEEIGQGKVIYLADNPLFRGFWLGGWSLFLHAVFYDGY